MHKCIFLGALISKFKDEPLLRSLRPATTVVPAA